MYLESPVSLNFFILSLFLVNGPKALYINLGHCISGMNLCPPNKNWFIISFISYLQIMLPIKGIPLKGELFPNNNLLASRSFNKSKFLTIKHHTF